MKKGLTKPLFYGILYTDRGKDGHYNDHYQLAPHRARI